MASERALHALVVALLAACSINDHLVPCGDIACPVNTVCTVGGCASKEAAAACAGKTDGDECTLEADAPGTCSRGACYARACGNGIVDLGEACDDGNQSYGDGCSADCRSDETCGNGVLDAFEAEECDSLLKGVSGDGCTSTCTNEIEVWRDSTATPLSGRTGSGIAYDSARHVIVLIGGISNNGIYYADTWEWNGIGWRLRRPATSPKFRSNVQIAYDTQHGRTVLFGGEGFLTLYSDTWEWDGITWTKRTTATTPPPRAGGTMAYDPVRHVAVLFSGHDAANNLFADTWEWDGTTWTQKATTGPARAQGAMTYDPVGQRMLLFGGSVAGNGMNDTWAWNGTLWTQLSPTNSPPNRFGAAIASETGRIVLYGGFSYLFGPILDDTWVWSGTNWAPLATSGSPGGRANTSMVFDGTRTVLISGQNAQGFVLDVQELTGSSWTTHAFEFTPFARTDHGLAYDSARGRTVLFGGRGLGRFGDTHEFDGASWLQIMPTGATPAPRTALAMVYDIARRTSIMFGGSTAIGAMNDLWEWNGDVWTQPPAANPPPARIAHAMSYDRDRDRIVVFGGQAADGLTLYGDTWEWDGAAWTQVATTGPSPRHGATMTYDAARHRSVLIGGFPADTSFGLSDEVWDWDGTVWTPAGTIAPFDPRARLGLAYDELRERLIGFGGQSYFTGVRDESFEWNGQFDERTPPLSPEPRAGSPLVYDALQHSALLFGGDNGPVFRDTLARRFESRPHPGERCLVAAEDSDGDGFAGCADPDCYGRCSPLCPPGLACPANAPRCGDGACGPVEDYLLCPSDCTAP